MGGGKIALKTRAVTTGPGKSKEEKVDDQNDNGDKKKSGDVKERSTHEDNSIALLLFC